VNRRHTFRARGPLGLAIGTAACLALAACSGDPSPAAHAKAKAAAPTGTPELKVSEAFVPQPVGNLAAGFLVVDNAGKGADKLLSVTSSVSDKISIHKTINNRMVEAKSFPIPAGGKLDLERGGNHIMFEDVKQPLKQGQNITVQLHFQKAPPITVTVPVKAANFDPSGQ
jgi:periplasmic copper chaperone A